MAQRILAVDDDEDICRLVQFCLERVGYAVQTAYNGREGLDLVAAERPDLIIADIMMPFMDGFEMVRRIKADPNTEDIPIIMLTARTGDTYVTEAWQQGVDLYLPKPFDPMELLSFVHRLLPQSEVVSGV